METKNLKKNGVNDLERKNKLEKLVEKWDKFVSFTDKIYGTPITRGVFNGVLVGTGITLLPELSQLDGYSSSDVVRIAYGVFFGGLFGGILGRIIGDDYHEK